jgi:hypothetical protein
MAYTTIDDPSAHFQISLWTGDGNDNRSIDQDGNSTFQPDMVWIKSRAGTQFHYMYDSTRGANIQLLVADGAGETTVADRLQAFESDGFQLGTSSEVNYVSGHAYVGWQWLANAGTRTTNAEDGNNPAGGYQANTTAGISVVDYIGTGAVGTMAHGLGAVPDCIIIKNRDEHDDWRVYHSANTSAPETDYLVFNLSSATADDATYWNDTAPTSSVFTVATAHNVNADGENYIAYCFAQKQGYSKMGSYTANDSADGPFVYTGFKPAWVMIKAEAAISWYVMDSTRNTYNPVIAGLNPDASGAEFTNQFIVDFLSNGFKIRNDNSGYGGSVNSTTHDPYLYMAFAENPFVTSTGIPATAR